jgi:hypothetical protein
MTINLADNNPRIEYAVAQSVTQTSFAVPFEFFDDSDLTVYVDGVVKTQGSDYTVSGGDGSTGTITMSVTGATGGSEVVIVRSIAIERTSDFSAGADINRAALNEQLDILTAMIADLKAKIDRTPSLPDYDTISYSFTLPDSASRANKYLAFGASGQLVASSGTTSTLVASAYGENFVAQADAAAALAYLGVTATAAELNVIGGLTATVTELNYVDGVTGSIQVQLDGKQPLDADLTALAALTGTGFIARTGSALFSGRTITGTSNQITVTDGDGVSGNPTIAAVVASQADAQAGTDNAKLMTALRTKEALNASGSAPTYACRAWANFNGTGTPAIRAAGNVTSITDHGSGDYTLNFDTALPDGNYCPVSLAGLIVVDDGGAAGTAKATTGFRFSVVSVAGARTDVANINIAIFR